MKFYYRGSVGSPIPAQPSCASSCEDVLAMSFQLKQNRVRVSSEVKATVKSITNVDEGKDDTDGDDGNAGAKDSKDEEQKKQSKTKNLIGKMPRKGNSKEVMTERTKCHRNATKRTIDPANQQITEQKKSEPKEVEEEMEGLARQIARATYPSTGNRPRQRNSLGLASSRVKMCTTGSKLGSCCYRMC